MIAIDKAMAEKSMAEGWFDDCYTQDQVEAIAKEKGYSFTMIKYWYGIEYEKQERASHVS